MKKISYVSRLSAGFGHFCSQFTPVKSLLCEIAFFAWVCLGTVFPVFIMIVNENFLSNLWYSNSDLVIALYIAPIVAVTIIARIVLFSRKVDKQNKVIKSHEAELEKIIEVRTKELQEAVSELEVIASTDHLTKIANTRLLKDTLGDEFNRSLRTKREFTVIMFDVDHFKKVNDSYGHAVGDKVLVAIADSVKKVVRDIDLFGRYGGEEFLVILPESDLTMATNVAERIRTTVEKIDLDGVTCTVSLGVTSNNGLISTSQMLDLADNALYSAKDAGRNNIKIITNKRN